MHVSHPEYSGHIADIQGTKSHVTQMENVAKQGAMQESAQQHKPDFALSLLRVIFSTSPMPASPLAHTLTEDLILGQLLKRQRNPPSRPPGGGLGLPAQQAAAGVSQEAGSRDGLARQDSYSEVQLATPIPADSTVSALDTLQQPGLCNNHNDHTFQHWYSYTRQA